MTMKDASMLNDGDEFRFNTPTRPTMAPGGDVFKVLRFEDDNVVVQRIASYWTNEQCWKIYGIDQEERFNPYCPVEVGRFKHNECEWEPFT